MPRMALSGNNAIRGPVGIFYILSYWEHFKDLKMCTVPCICISLCSLLTLLKPTYKTCRRKDVYNNFTSSRNLIDVNHTRTNKE